jgi:hypothetical protein
VTTHDGDDVVGQGGGRLPLPGWRLSRGSLVLAALTLLVGLGAGYATGQRHMSGGAPGAGATAPQRPRTSPSPVSPLVAVSPALTQLTTGCSAQVGQKLQLGIPVTNRADAAVTLGGVEVTTPMGGLRVISRQWGPCGALPEEQAMFNSVLAPGDSTWLTVTFQVLVKCPGPLPVQFTVGYDVGGQHGVATLPGFPDLSQVPYKSCPAD